MTDKQRTFGQFETPPGVADLLLALCVRRAGDRVLDPSCGSGLLLERAARWQQWLSGAEQRAMAQLWGVELEQSAGEAAQERLPGAHIALQNFFTIEPSTPFDAIVGNPPYTRAEWFNLLEERASKQLALFAQAVQPEKEAKSAIIPGQLWNKELSRRAGLYAYFILHGARFLREGGRFGFVLPNNWLDVGYGEALKAFLLEHFRIITLIESTAERWFADARVHTCLLIMEKCAHAPGREAQLVRFVQLRQPLRQLVAHGQNDRDRFSAVERLVTRLLPAQDYTSDTLRVRVVPQERLRAAEKWGAYWRAPAVVQRARRNAARRGLAPLKEWATIRRGFTTGANSFFYLDAETVQRWQIEPQFRRPLLKSLRDIDCLAPGEAGGPEVLLISATDVLAGTGTGAYVAWGESQGFHERSTCRARQPWYALPYQEPAGLALAKGVWERHLAPLFQRPLLIDQQLYRLTLHAGISARVAAALLNSAWLAVQMELQGRVNFGEGVLWLAGYEIENLLLPEPRLLQRSEVERLEECFTRVSRRKLAHDLSQELATPDRRQLDEAVFDVVGVSATEAGIIRETLLERLAARQIAHRAQ